MNSEITSFLDYKDASKFLGIKVETLYLLVMQKRIPHIRLGNRFVRFSKPDLEKWMASLKQEVQR